MKIIQIATTALSYKFGPDVPVLFALTEDGRIFGARFPYGDASGEFDWREIKLPEGIGQ